MMRIRNGLLLLTGLAVLAVGYRYTPDIARFFIFRDTNRRTATNLPATSQAQKIVRDSLPAAGLTEASLLSETWEDRTDPHGSWVVYRGAWRLPDGQPPEEVARRLKALVLGAVPQSEVYSVESDNGDLEIRIYHQSRLAALLRLEPTLLEWPPFSASTPPLLAIVLFGVDEAPQAVHELLSKPYPLAFALSPYSPFTLRVARDAVLAHKEVLVLADEDQPPSDLLQIVPHASGIVFINNPGGDPVEQARHIAAEGLYVYDTVQRLHDSRFGDADVSDIRRYIKLGPLGRAFSSDKQVVLLIDEVDKADIEFPNDLLNELDTMEFTIPETGDTIQAKIRPFVVITSNNEKELPDAFLRRCVFHFIDFPDEELMRRIVLVHHPDLADKVLDQCIEVFYRIREVPGLRKRPSTSELIDWVAALRMSGMDQAKLARKVPFLGTLVKQEQDLERVSGVLHL